MKPVFARTMGQGHKTLDASSFLADPSAWRSLSVKVCTFHQSRVSLVYASTREVQLSASDKVHRCHHVASLALISCRCEVSPGSALCQRSTLSHLTARPCKSSPMADQRPRESSDPRWLWDQVHNVRDQYTQGIVLSRSTFFLISPSSTATTLVLTKMWDYFGSTNSSQKWEIKPGV